MQERHDVVIIGSGPAGGVAARELRDAGLSVALVDADGFGGTCPLRGCEPKKTLVDAALAHDLASRLRGKALTGGTSLDWPLLHGFERGFLDGLAERIEQSYAQRGVTTIHGRARFLSPEAVDVGGRELTAGHFLVATGARPKPLGIPGAELARTSDEFLDLAELPRRIVFIGGGFISFESAHAAARAGAACVIVQRGPRALKRFDPDLTARLVEHTRAMGVEVHLNAAACGIDKTGDGFLVHCGEAGLHIPCDAVFHGAGRAPALEGMGLDLAGVDSGEDGIKVSASMRTANPRIFAAGDCVASGFQLTPVAAMEARVAARNILRGTDTPVSYAGVASAVYTIPTLARTGLTEEEARAQGLDFETSQGDSARWNSSRRIGQTASGWKVLVESGTRRVLGAHILSHNAEEAINAFALAIRHGLTADELLDQPWCYPSFTYDTRHML